MTETMLRRYLTERALESTLIFLLENIASACLGIAHLARNGAFADNLGGASAANVQGETRKTLDNYSE